LSRESIERNINGSNNAEDSKQVEFECYGPQGIQIIVGGLTDNVNRITSNLRGYLSKLHGDIAKQNSVKIFFDNVGYIAVLKTDAINIDKIMESTMPYEVIDIVDQEDAIEVKVSPKDFYAAKQALSDGNAKILDAEIKLMPQNIITELTQENVDKLERFIDSCNEDDDMQ
jgi:transcriptional/translational regulatory protein YebC/TACO1